MYTLIVEDDVLLMKVMVAQIENIDLPVRATATGNAALAMIQQELPALLILDVTLPDISAFEIIEQLRHNPQTSTLPVIVHTNLDLTQADVSRLELGPTKVINKSTAYSVELDRLVLEMINTKR